jgi:hypothetical protein
MHRTPEENDKELKRKDGKGSKMTTDMSPTCIAKPSIDMQFSPGFPGTSTNDFLPFLDSLMGPLNFEGGSKMFQTNQYGRFLVHPRR